MDERMHRIGIWSGIAMMPLFLLGFGIFAEFIPPPAPSASAIELSQRFAENRTGIKLGLFTTMYASALLCLFFAVISAQIRYIAGRTSVLSIAQTLAAACAVLEFIFPLFSWQTAAFRADRSPENIQLMNDLAWLPFMGLSSTFVFQLFFIAWAALSDTRDEPVWPRWVGYLNIWAGISIGSGAFVVFFQDGPLAWNGILGFWVVAAAFFIWLLAMCIVMFQAAKAHAEPSPITASGATGKVTDDDLHPSEVR